MNETFPDHVENFIMPAGFCWWRKYRYEGKPMLHKKLLKNSVSQYPNFIQKHWEKRQDTYYKGSSQFGSNNVVYCSWW